MVQISKRSHVLENQQGRQTGTVQAVLFLCLLLGSAGCKVLGNRPSSPSVPLEQAADQAAERIRQVLTQHIGEMTLKRQSHFFVRLYRTTRQTEYIPVILENAQQEIDYFVRDIQQPGADIPSPEPEYREGQKPQGVKQRKRAEVLDWFARFKRARRILFRAYQLQSFHLHRGDIKPQYNQALEYLSQVSFDRLLLHDQIIRFDTASAVNDMFYLKFLSLKDREEAFTARFQKVFMAQADETMDDVDFQNKIYGLTHFIIAASSYYQKAVPPRKYQWILDDLEKNLDSILVRTKPDVAAEIGIAFKLCGQPDHPAVKKVQQYLLDRIDPQQGILMPSDKEWNLNRVEHRNAVAYLALKKWWGLYPGPDLLKVISEPTRPKEFE